MDATTTAIAKLLAGFGITIMLGTSPGAATVVSQQSTSSTPAPIAISTPANTGSDSVNWSGYVAESGTYTSVSGTWTVPTVSNPTAATADATWVGIGGVKSRDLIQAGTELVPTTNGGVEYRAWYELLPGNSEQIALTVSPGDSVSVSITRDTGNSWLISFNDNTTGKNYQTTVSYNSSLSSAEWIEELPVATNGALSLDNFGSVNFTSGFAIQNGSAVTIAQSGAQPLQMQNNAGQTIAAPSVLGSDGASFSVARTDASASPLALSRFGRAVPTFAAVQATSGSQPQIQVISSRHHGRTFVIRFF